MASRRVASRLSLDGNLIVRNQGVVDYGSPNDRVLVSATIRWFLNESLYVGGATMMPIPTDIGLWAMDDATVWVHGRYRDTWASMTETLPAGGSTIRVDPAYAQGWQVGDELAITQTNPLEGEAPRREDERRRIAAVRGPGLFDLDRPVSFTHAVRSVSWRDTWGDAWTETMSGKVANLTSNIRFEAGDPNHRPHIMFMDRANHYVEDLAVQNFSPAPKFIGFHPRFTDVQLPFGRYAWHNHTQDGGSRGSYLRRTRIYDGLGDGLHIHESWGIEVTDLVVYNQARIIGRDPRSGEIFQAAAPIFLEPSIDHRYFIQAPSGTFPDPQGHTCDDSRLDRPLIFGTGQDVLTREYYGSMGIWIFAAKNCAIVGGAFSGNGGSGIFWAEGAGGPEVPHVYRQESFANRGAGFFSWHNYLEVPTERIIDMLTWNNSIGWRWGAYGTEYWGHQVRSLGNEIQLQHFATGWGLTGFLADGLGRPGAEGIHVGRYGPASTRDSVYEDGVVRNIAVNALTDRTPDTGRRTWVQFARIAWQPGGTINYTSPAIPLESHWRIRNQQGLTYPANFTLYRTDEPSVACPIDTSLNAKRCDNDAAETRPAPARVRIVAPGDDGVFAGMVTVVVESSAPTVGLWEANRFLGSAATVNGRATFSFNMANHPYRRAYLWASSRVNGAVNTSRVIRIRKS